jgi:hypothetical protein
MIEMSQCEDYLTTLIILLTSSTFNFILFYDCRESCINIFYSKELQLIAIIFLGPISVPKERHVITQGKIERKRDEALCLKRIWTQGLKARQVLI